MHILLAFELSLILKDQVREINDYGWHKFYFTEIKYLECANQEISTLIFSQLNTDTERDRCEDFSREI